MGLFGQQPAKRKRGQHGPPRAGADRLAAAKARAINMALAKRPDLAEQIALRELGMEGGADPFDQFMERLEKFRGIMPEVEEASRPSGLIDWQALGAGVASILVGLAQTGALGAAPAAALGPGTPASAPAAPEPAAEAALAVPVAERRRRDPLPEPTTFPARMAHAMLVGATPSEAAAILAGQTGFGVPDVVAYLATTPDAEVMLYLGRMKMKHAHLAPLFAWVERDPEWTVAVVRELRRLRGVEAPEAAA